MLTHFSNHHDAIKSPRRLASPARLLAVSLLLLLVAPAHAGRYELIKGKGVEVCEAYGRNLNSFNPTEPMICERQIDPQLTQFERPEWKSLDIWENRNLFWSTRVALGETSGTMTPNVEEWIKERSKMPSPKLYTAAIDIDNDGRIENVLMYKNGICGDAMFRYVTALLVQQDAEPQINLKKTKPLLNALYRLPYQDDPSFKTYGVFRYKNIAYFDVVADRPTESDKLSVFKLAQGQSTGVCEYRFVAR